MTVVPETSYCRAAQGHDLHGPYHDEEYGFPVRDDDVLFERLCLEINQAGLSWLTILKKRQGMRDAYDGFSVARVAGYGETDTARLLADARIIRNRLKVNAAIYNAGRSWRYSVRMGASPNGSMPTTPCRRVTGSGSSRRPSASPGARSPVSSS